MLDLWVLQAIADNLLLTGKVLCQKWRTFANRVGVPADEQLSLSKGWLSWYKSQTGLKQTKHHGEAASALPSNVAKERLHIQKILKDGGYAWHNVFNGDETRLFYVYVHFVF